MAATLQSVRRSWEASLGRDGPVAFPWVALALAASVVATAVVAGVLTHELSDRVGNAAGFGWPALEAGRWWTVGSSFLLTRNWFMAVTMPSAIFGVLAPYERRAGHARTFAIAVLGHVTGSVLVAIACGFLGWSNIPAFVRAAQNLDYGGSMVVAAGLGALASRVGNRRLVTIAFVGVVLLVPLHHQMADWGHLVALPVGFLADRFRESRRAVLGFLSAVMGTTVLTWFGAPAVQATVQRVRFEHPARTAAVQIATTPVGSGGPGALLPQPPPRPPARGRVVTVRYLAGVLEGRPEAATVYLPPGARGPLPVVVFLHGLPGTGRDWVDGGAVDQLLDGRIAAGTFPRAIAVFPTADLFHDPTAAWGEVPGQRSLSSIRGDLLRAVARVHPLLTGSHQVAVVGVGRGADGAAALARLDPGVGYVVAIDPRVDGEPAVPIGTARVTRWPDPPRRDADATRPAGDQWTRWRRDLPGALDWLARHGFGARPGASA